MEIMIDHLIVKKVAEIARLNLSDQEIKKFSSDLTNILEAFKELEKVKLDGVNPTFQPIEIKDIIREDKIEKCFDEKIALENVKENKEDGYFKGPKVV